MFVLHSNFTLSSKLKFFSSSKFFKSTLFVLFTLTIFLIAMFAQSSSPILHTIITPTSSSPDQVRTFDQPTTSNPSANTRTSFINSVDSNNNLIADGLDTLLTHSLPNDQIKVIVMLKDSNPIPSAMIQQFKTLGGHITFQWDSLGMFAGSLSAQAIKGFARSNLVNSPLALIEQDRPLLKYSQSDQLTNVEPYVWSNYGLLGDENNSIAIFDTGVDPSHPMLANYSATPDFTNNSIKIIGWKDATNNGYTTPVDYDGHGTHVAAIAAGNPYNDTISQGIYKDNINTTYSFSYNGTSALSGTYSSWTYLNVSHAGYINMKYYWQVVKGSSSTKGVGIYLYSPTGSLVTFNTTETSSSSTSGVYSLSKYIGSNFGPYELQLDFNYLDPNSNLNMIAYGNYPHTNEIANATKTRFSGVAPDTKIVSIRVFDNNGNGLGSYLINGINWAIANKKTYHISVASMSIGFGCSPTGCVPSDAVASVETAVNDLVNAGVVTFVAAGNDGYSNGDQIGTPANLDSVITIGATDMYHNVTPYSSIGPGLNSLSMKPDLTAPGGYDTDPLSTGGYPYQEPILSADTNMNDAAEGSANAIITDFQKNDLTAMQGTSMATPYAAGIGSLIIQAMGGYNNWTYSTSMVKKVKQIMLMSTWATNGTRAIKNIHEGWGEIQADAAIDVVKQPGYTIGSKVNFNLSTDRFSNKIWGRKVSLTANTQYDFLLNTSSTLTADLYLYSNNYDSYGQPILLQVSKGNGLGLPESLTFTPSSNGTYYLYVKTWSGKGTFSLSSNNHPYISGPKTIYLPIGTTGQINWTIFDLHPANYTIFKDGTIIANGNWTNFVPITVVLANLPKGTYNYTILAFDQKNLSATNQVIVISYHRASITSSGNLSFPEGTTGKVIEWSVSDDALANYTIYQNGLQKENKQITGTSATIIYNLDGLSVGNYNFTLAVFDQDNILVTNSVNVLVIANTQTTNSSITSSKSITSTFGFEGVAVLAILTLLVVKRKRNKF